MSWKKSPVVIVDCWDCGKLFKTRSYGPNQTRYCSERCKKRCQIRRRKVRDHARRAKALQCTLDAIYRQCLTGKAIREAA